MKKLTILFLSFIAALSISACKKNENNEGNNDESNDNSDVQDDIIESNGIFAYRLLEDGTYEVDEIVDREKEEYIVPSSYNGRPVTGIDEDVFDYLNAKRIIISDGIKYIHSNFFEECNELEYVSIPNSIEDMREVSFASLPKLKLNKYENAYYIGNESNPYNVLVEGISYDISEVNINKKTRIIGYNAFSNYEKLTSISFPIDSNIVCISDYAFEDCMDLVDFKIPNTVKYIGDYAFEECYNLTELVLPTSFVEMGHDILYSTTQAYNLYNDGYYIGYKDNPYYCFMAPVSYSIENLVIHKDTVMIAPEACSDYTNLKSVEFEEGSKLKRISDEAFRYCGNLVSFKCPNTVEEIGDYAFQDCVALADLILSNNIETLEYYCFDGCTSLTSTEYKGMYYIGSEENPYLMAHMGIQSEDITSVTIHSDAVYIGAYAFCNENITTVEFEEDSKLKYIREYAFYDSIIESIVIPKSVERIYTSAFYSSDIKSISFEEDSNLIYIGSYVFESCYYLETFIMPDSVLDTGKGLFEYCDSLKTVKFSKNLYNIEEDTFYWCEKLESVEFPEKIEYIGSECFAYCSMLKDITLPEGLKTFGENVFSNCYSIKEMVIPSSVSVISAALLYECNSLEKLVLHDGIEKIGNYCFQYNDSITNYNEYENVKYLGTEEQPYMIAWQASNEYITEATIHKDTKFIHSGVFADCVDLEKINFENSDNIRFIGEAAFKDTSIKSFEIPRNITRIEKQLFYCCYELEYVIIPSKVEEISDYAFTECTSLNEIYVERSKKGFEDILGYEKLESYNVRYYTNCVHYLDEWTYVDGKISTEAHMKDKTVVESTCVTNGFVSATCDLCGEKFKYKLDLGKHNYIDGNCVVCGKIDLGCEIYNDEVYPFIVEGDSITSTNNEDDSTSIYKIVANESVTISFNYRTSCESGWDMMYIYLNSEQMVSASGQQTESTSYSVTLAAGDILEICYDKDGSVSEGDDCVYITDFLITKAL